MTKDAQEKADTADAVAAVLSSSAYGLLQHEALSVFEEKLIKNWLKGTKATSLADPRLANRIRRLEAAIQLRRNQLLEQQNRLLGELVEHLKGKDK